MSGPASMTLLEIMAELDGLSRIARNQAQVDRCDALVEELARRRHDTCPECGNDEVCFAQPLCLDCLEEVAPTIAASYARQR